jgi:hypothetical protein
MRMRYDAYFYHNKRPNFNFSLNKLIPSCLYYLIPSSSHEAAPINVPVWLQDCNNLVSLSNGRIAVGH